MKRKFSWTAGEFRWISEYKRVVRGIIYRLDWSGGGALSVEVGLEGDLRWSWSACQFLLLLEFFATGFDRDCETNLGLLLRADISPCLRMWRE